MKKFLSIALALLMVCVMLPVVALADEGITTEQALKDAITAVTDGATITPVSYTHLDVYKRQPRSSLPPVLMGWSAK